MILNVGLKFVTIFLLSTKCTKIFRRKIKIKLELKTIPECPIWFIQLCFHPMFTIEIYSWNFPNILSRKVKVNSPWVFMLDLRQRMVKWRGKDIHVWIYAVVFAKFCQTQMFFIMSISITLCNSSTLCGCTWVNKDFIDA